MAKYSSMEEMVAHLKRKAANKPYSDAKVDELIIALGEEKRSSRYLQRALEGRHWDALYNAMVNGFVLTQYWKHSHRTYWLSHSGISYLGFLTELDERDSETESVTDDCKGEGLLFEEQPEEQPQEQPPAKASEVQKELGATILSDKDRLNVQGMLAYYQCLLLADEINRSASMFLVSVEPDHSVVQINGSINDRVQMLELIKQLAQQEQTDDTE